jgi:hypothetical protein
MMLDSKREQAVTVGDDLPDREALVRMAEAVLRAGHERGAVIRAVGGVAIALRCPSARPPGLLTRSYSDLDFIARRRDVKRVTESFVAVGLKPAERFNALNSSRMQFDHARGYHADVFLDDFSMCHSLSLSDRLEIDSRTISLSDLLLTKLQVARLSRKDVSDISALLLDHPVTDDDAGVNAEYMADLLARDWGWWRTATETLSRLESLLVELPIDATAVETISNRVAALEDRIEMRSKGVRWRTRAKVGDRLPWREDPEDVAG